MSKGHTICWGASGMGRLGGLGDRERCVGFLARATRAALFSRIRFLASTHTYIAYAHARTLPITSSQRMSAQKQQAKAQSRIATAAKHRLGMRAH